MNCREPGPSQAHSGYDGSKSQSQIVGIEFIGIFCGGEGRESNPPGTLRPPDWF
jgi:hypothetical protein